MNFSVGIYDLFAYAIPGSLHLSLLIYVVDQQGWANAEDLGRVPLTLLVAFAVILSYVLGHLTYPLSRALDRIPRSRLDTVMAAVRRRFLDRAPGARAEALVATDLFLIQAAVEIHHPEAVAEVNRLRAQGLMLRNCAAAMLIAALVAATEALLGDRPAFAATSAILLAVLGVVGVHGGQRFRSWAAAKTLEVAYWTSDVNLPIPARPAVPDTVGSGRG
ncbi:hypothetical protein ACFOW4_04115 [Micromonospora sp. GCM10011542]|uniref:hypothetical protein n=1 Tax=Micromonospora sp. GCM10011542 TaxID=3317337 RepID=UPI0036133D7B